MRNSIETEKKLGCCILLLSGQWLFCITFHLLLKQASLPSITWRPQARHLRDVPYWTYSCDYILPPPYLEFDDLLQLIERTAFRKGPAATILTNSLLKSQKSSYTEIFLFLIKDIHAYKLNITLSFALATGWISPLKPLFSQRFLWLSRALA